MLEARAPVNDPSVDRQGVECCVVLGEGEKGKDNKERRRMLADSAECTSIQPSEPIERVSLECDNSNGMGLMW